MAEVIIIGGGVIGLSVGAALAAAGYAPLLLAADGGEGAGASGCAPALLLPPTGRLAGSRIGRAAHASWRLWPAWDAWLAAAVGDAPLLRASGATVRRRGTDRHAVGGWTPGALHLARLREALVRGGGAVQSATATALRRTAAGVEVQCADGAARHAAVVIVAAGMGGAALSVDAAPVALRGQAGLALHLGGVTLDRPLCGDGVSLTPAADGRGVWATGDWADGEDGAPLPLWDAAAALHAQAAALLGRWGEREALLTGARPRRCGGAPPVTVMDAAAGGRIIAAVGHGRNGFLLAPLTALALLALLDAPRPPWADAAALDAAANLIGAAAAHPPAPDAAGAGASGRAPDAARDAPAGRGPAPTPPHGGVPRMPASDGSDGSAPTLRCHDPVAPAAHRRHG